METILGIIIATALTNGISLIISHPLAYLLTSNKNQDLNISNDNVSVNNTSNSVFESNPTPIIDKSNTMPAKGLNMCIQCNTVVLPKTDGTCPNCGSRSYRQINSTEELKRYHKLEHRIAPAANENLPKYYIRVFILIDILAHVVAGYLIGFYTGYFFYGVAFKKRFWPGIIAIAVASYIGASRYMG